MLCLTQGTAKPKRVMCVCTACMLCGQLPFCSLLTSAGHVELVNQLA